MAREPEDLAELRRALGSQLAVFRAAAELTQDQIARAAFCDRTTVTHIEKGRARGDERFWTIADELCGAGGALLAAFRAVVAAKQTHEVRIREAQLAESRAKAQALRLTLRGGQSDRGGSGHPRRTGRGEPGPGSDRRAGHRPPAGHMQFFRLGALPVQDVTSPRMFTGLALSEAQAYAGLRNIEEAQRALRQAEQLRQHTTDSTALDLAHRITTEVAA
jgi:DNA-binding XRE family transcriptional regulator